jgi:hypothetical protein
MVYDEEFHKRRGECQRRKEQGLVCNHHGMTIAESINEKSNTLWTLLDKFSTTEGNGTMSMWKNCISIKNHLDSDVVLFANAIATDYFLQGSMDVPGLFAAISLLVQAFLSVEEGEGPEQDASDLSFASYFEFAKLCSKLSSERQLVRHLAKRLPCRCLDECLAQMTKDASTNRCEFCCKRFPTKECKRCSKCRILKYCSKECQTKHWYREHKEICRLITRF